MPIKIQSQQLKSEENVKPVRRFEKKPVKFIKSKPDDKPKNLRQIYYHISQDKKIQLLIHLIKNEKDVVIVFCNAKKSADELSRKLKENNIKVKVHTGNPNQMVKKKPIDQVKEFNVLIATDLAIQGLPMDAVKHIYNYEIPKEEEQFFNRVSGIARPAETYVFVSSDEDKNFLKDILFSVDGNIKIVNEEDAFREHILPVQEKNKFYQKEKQKFSRPEKPDYNKNYNKQNNKNQQYKMRNDKEKENHDRLTSPLKSMDYYNQRKKEQPRRFKKPEKKVRPWRNY